MQLQSKLCNLHLNKKFIQTCQKKKIGLLLPESNSLDVDLCKYKLLKTIYSSFVNTVVSWTKKNFKSCFGLFVLWTIKKKPTIKKKQVKESIREWFTESI